MQLTFSQNSMSHLLAQYNVSMKSTEVCIRLSRYAMVPCSPNNNSQLEERKKEITKQMSDERKVEN